ncbi:MAG: 5'-methylthioadenosine/S-adenosylhomocysteine nucleosidase [Spirochaetaceae bacterium]|jgi:adenosylhomocysteine nucleosidase|nr:5'-methylthioadenosine/S-adenosylhomocysteine nucleosidase [Spirochaetaceae bacterium]
MKYKRIGIIGAMEEEVEILRSHLKNAAPEAGCLIGQLCGKDAALLKCGVGKVNAAVGTALLIDHFKPDFVINTGCAGGVNNAGDAVRLCFGDVVLSERIVYHDVDVTGFNYPLGQIPGQELFFTTPPEILKEAEDAIAALKKDGILPSNMNSVRGLIGSGDVFMCETQRIKTAAALFPGLRAVEMESAAIAHVCALFKTPCLVIRAISDIAGEESPVDFDAYLPIAAKHSSEIVLSLLER